MDRRPNSDVCTQQFNHGRRSYKDDRYQRNLSEPEFGSEEFWSSRLPLTGGAGDPLRRFVADLPKNIKENPMKLILNALTTNKSSNMTSPHRLTGGAQIQNARSVSDQDWSSKLPLTGGAGDPLRRFVANLANGLKENSSQAILNETTPNQLSNADISNRLTGGARPDRLTEGAAPDHLPVTGGACPDRLTECCRPNRLTGGARPHRLTEGARQDYVPVAADACPDRLTECCRPNRLTGGARPDCPTRCALPANKQRPRSRSRNQSLKDHPLLQLLNLLRANLFQNLSRNARGKSIQRKSGMDLQSGVMSPICIFGLVAILILILCVSELRSSKQ